MVKFLLLLVTCWALIHKGNTANTNRASSEEISFVEPVDDASDAIREKIRTEMDDYIRIKEMAFKNKTLNNASTTAKAVEESLVTEVKTTEPEKPTTESIAAAAAEVTSTTPPTTSETSTTIRKIELDVGKEVEDDTENSATETDYEDTTPLSTNTNSSHPTHIDDRFILNVRTMCKDGLVAVSNKCRKVV